MCVCVCVLVCFLEAGEREGGAIQMKMFAPFFGQWKEVKEEKDF